MKTGLYFGSFNPIHNGHLIIANKMYEAAGFDEVWFIPSPQNPFKESNNLLDFSYRYKMIETALENLKHLKVDPIEEKLPKPSYTIQTIEALEKEYPQREFHIIMGSDNLVNFHLWKKYEELLQKCHVHVYVRSSTENADLPEYEKVKVYQLPILDISSTAVRNSIKEGKSIIGEVDSKIHTLIMENQWYFPHL